MIIKSILDTDLYKITQGQMAFSQFPEAIVQYEFKNRGRTTVFHRSMVDKLKNEIFEMSNLKMTFREYEYLKGLRFLKPTFLEWFKNYKFDPLEVNVNFIPSEDPEFGNITLKITGPWFRTVYWEVPLMALISELHFQDQTKEDGWELKIDKKAIKMDSNNVSWIDFGTRRRASLEVQDEVVSRMEKYSHFRGTSNVFLAMYHNVKAQGTVAHETYQIMQAKYGLTMANHMATEHWVKEYGGDLGIMLPDTLTTDVFMRSMTRLDAKLWDGARQDSGNLIEAAQKYIDKLISFDIDPKTKVLVPSDSLTDDAAIAFSKHFEGKVRGITAGIGTFLSNDCGLKPLNMVIKMTGADFGFGMIDVIKLSDVPGKYTGSPQRIAEAKQVLRIVD